MVTGQNPNGIPEVIQQFIKMAKAKGFDTDSLIYVEQKSAEVKQ
ncbi:outer membrane lipoprotein Blc [Shewanella putrefaciens]|nr:outer membrane lipoprotein Blc [Shewanella putrefaciens]